MIIDTIRIMDNLSTIRQFQRWLGVLDILPNSSSSDSYFNLCPFVLNNCVNYIHFTRKSHLHAKCYIDKSSANENVLIYGSFLFLWVL